MELLSYLEAITDKFFIHSRYIKIFDQVTNQPFRKVESSITSEKK